MSTNQKIIIGALVVVIVFVFCCAGLVAISAITKPQNNQAVAVVPRPENIQQQAEKPQDEIVQPDDPAGTPPPPTNTPIPPTNTPEPANEIQLDVQLYGLEVAEHTNAIVEVLGKFSELMAEPRIGEDDWTISVAVQVATIQLEHEALAEMDVPADMAEIHPLILDATQDCNDGMDYVSSGIDNLNPDDLKTANTLILSCGEKIKKPLELMSEYSAQFD